MNLYEKISSIMEEVKHLQKDSSVSTGGGGAYKAISEEKVTATIRKSLIKHKIVIIPVGREVSRTNREYTDKYGKPANEYFTDTTTTYKIINAEKPEESEIAMSAGQGIDKQDKGIGKAITYDYKYLLLRVFAISTGEDPDNVFIGGDIDESVKADLELISTVKGLTDYYNKNKDKHSDNSIGFNALLANRKAEIDDNSTR